MNDSFTILESLPDAVVVVDRSANILYINPKAELLFDYTKSQLIGKPIHELVPDDLRETHAKHFSRYMEQPQMRPMSDDRPFKGRKREGQTFTAEINLSPIQTTDGTVVMAIIRKSKNQ